MKGVGNFENTKLQQAPASRYCFEMVGGVLGLPRLGLQALSNAGTCLNTPVMTVRLHFGGLVIATRSGKHKENCSEARVPFRSEWLQDKQETGQRA